MDNIAFHFLLGAIACIIDALPFGLVNLSVVDLSINISEKAAFSFSIGASFVEILFALAAILLGKNLNMLIEGNEWIEFGIVFVLLSSGIYFLFKPYVSDYQANYKVPYLFKGMLFNLISIQVLLYWFLAIAFLENNGNSNFVLPYIIGFAGRAGFGKMLTLIFYKLISKQIKKRSAYISRKINFIIGLLLIVVAMFQLSKSFF